VVLAIVTIVFHDLGHSENVYDDDDDDDDDDDERGLSNSALE